MSTTYSLGTPHLNIEVSSLGAELLSLKDGKQKEWLWQAGPQWPRRSPVLFPIVGKLKDNTAHIENKLYTIPQHGFARDMEFEWTKRKGRSCTLTLLSNDKTLEAYPFPFLLELNYSVTENSLTVAYRVKNTGKTSMPASLGVHPAFIWPIEPNVKKTDHYIAFAHPESADVRRLHGGLLQKQTFPSPVQGKTLHLSDELFNDDALIFDKLSSTQLVYGLLGKPALSIKWEGFKELGIWMKPGAHFVCIEPWYGFASPEEFNGEFSKKVGLFHLLPDEEKLFSWTVTLL